MSINSLKSSQAIRSIPDWQNMFIEDDCTILPAFGNENLFFALPSQMNLEFKEINNSKPDFFLEFVSNSEDPIYSILTIGLAYDMKLGKVRECLRKRNPNSILVPDSFSSEVYWHFECNNQRETHPFAWERAGRARIVSRLSSKTGKLIYNALANDSATMCRIAIECGVVAFLPRIDRKVTIDVASVITELKKLNPNGDDSIPFQGMLNYFKKKGVVSSTEESLALAGRMCDSFGKSAPCPNISSGPFVILAPDREMPSNITWDLSKPLMTVIPKFLSFDPFTFILKEGNRDDVVGFSKTPSFPLDLLEEKITVAATLPSNIQGCDEISVDLCVEKEFSQTKQTECTNVIIYSPGLDYQKSVHTLKFSKQKLHPYKVKVTAIFYDKVLETEWFEGSPNYQHIGWSHLPGKLVNVTVSKEILSQAELSVSIVKGETHELETILSKEKKSAAFLLSPESINECLEITAKDLSGEENPIVLELPVRSVNLDLHDFSEYGFQSIEVDIELGGLTEADIEFKPVFGDGTTTILHFTNENSSQIYNYNSEHLFKNKYQYRLINLSQEQKWSEPKKANIKLEINLKNHV